MPGGYGRLLAGQFGRPQRGAPTRLHMRCLGPILSIAVGQTTRGPRAALRRVGCAAVDDLRERIVGCVLGLALGDALGAPFEFRRREAIPDPLPAFQLGWSGLPPGTWTDDTSMARNLWRSLAEHRRLDPADVVGRHLEWFATDPPDVGNLTRWVLRRIGDGNPDAAARYVAERGPEVSAGNGSVMYCAPLGAFRAARPELLDDEAPALSAITHWDERCRT